MKEDARQASVAAAFVVAANALLDFPFCNPSPCRILQGARTATATATATGTGTAIGTGTGTGTVIVIVTVIGAIRERDFRHHG
eukprot:gene34645-42837_t